MDDRSDAVDQEDSARPAAHGSRISAVGARVRRVGWRAFGALHDEWRTGRVSLAGLTAGQRLVARAAIGVIVVAAGFIVLASVGLGFPGQIAEAPGFMVGEPAPVAIPTLVMELACIGLAISAAAIGISAIETGAVLGRGLLLLLAVILAGLGGTILASTEALATHVQMLPEASPAAIVAYRLSGTLALSAAVALPLLMLSRLLRRGLLLAAVAASPFLGLLVAIVLASTAPPAAISAWEQSQAPDYPATLHLTATMLGPLVFVWSAAGGLLGLLSVWQARAWSKASARQVGRRVGRIATRAAWVLGILLGLKLAWLLAGGLGLLPTVLGGASAAWPGLRSDDAFAWGHATLLVSLAGIWLLRRPGGIRESRVHLAAGMAGVAFGSVALLIAALPLLAAMLDLLSPATRPPLPHTVHLPDCLEQAAFGASGVLSCLAFVLQDWQAVWWTAVIVGALVIGTVLLRRQPTDGAGLFLVVLGAWTLPRAVDVIRQIPPADAPVLGRLPAMNAAQPETIDIALTVLVLVFAVGWWARWQRAVDPGALSVILVVSTLVVHAGTLLPIATLAVFVALPIAFPAVYDVFFEAEEVNDGPRRSTRLFAWLGMRALALTLLAALVVVDLRELTTSFTLQLGLIFFGIPFGAALVAAQIGRQSRSQEAATGDGPAHSDRRALLQFAAGGVLAALAFIGATSLSLAAGPSIAAVYPTEGSLAAELEARTEAVGAELGVALRQPDDPALPGQIEGLRLREVRWLDLHPAPPCAGGAWAAWRVVLDDIRAFAIFVAATNQPPPTAPATEIDAVLRVADELQTALIVDEAALREALAAARTGCRSSA